MIDLDKIWSKPYFSTKMQVKFEGMVQRIIDAKIEDIQNAPYEFCTQV